MVIAGLGSICFGLVLGWISSWSLRLKAVAGLFTDIVIIIEILGGAAISALFKSDVLFSLYCISLAIGFFAYVVIDLVF